MGVGPCQPTRPMAQRTHDSGETDPRETWVGHPVITAVRVKRQDNSARKTTGQQYQIQRSMIYVSLVGEDRLGGDSARDLLNGVVHLAPREVLFVDAGVELTVGGIHAQQTQQ